VRKTKCSSCLGRIDCLHYEGTSLQKCSLPGRARPEPKSSAGTFTQELININMQSPKNATNWNRTGHVSGPQYGGTCRARIIMNSPSPKNVTNWNRTGHLRGPQYERPAPYRSTTVTVGHCEQAWPWELISRASRILAPKMSRY
jgi:hypothetical protein